MSQKGLTAGIAIIALVAGMPTGMTGAPVDRAAALRAAADRLPTFFSGSWLRVDDFSMVDPEGTTRAYTVVFHQGDTRNAASPANFLARVRQQKRAAGRQINENSSDLYGSDRYASIVVSADDTEPVVIRCYRGLPATLVKLEAAQKLARATGKSDLRLAQHLMLGMFDETVLLESPDGSERVVVDMRTRTTTSLQEAQTRAKRKTGVTRSKKFIEQCRMAWAPYVKEVALNAPKKKVVVPEDQ